MAKSLPESWSVWVLPAQLEWAMSEPWLEAVGESVGETVRDVVGESIGEAIEGVIGETFGDLVLEAL